MQTDAGNPDARFSPGERTSATLLQRVRNWGDDASWRQFFEIYSRFINSLAIRAGLTATEADEVTQATLIAVADRIRTFQYNRESGSFKAWLAQQAHWKIQDQLRRRQREQRTCLQRDIHGAESPTATMNLLPDERCDYAALSDREWHEAVLNTAIARVKARVSPKQYQMFDLYVMKQWPLRRISRALGVSVAQVYVVKSRISFFLKRQTRQVRAQLERSPLPGVPKQN
jgi:RNA polymerase sigma factor (sigma-70 family)